MFSQRKEQGFIIRKNRNIQSHREDRKKFMSQTDFFKKNQLTSKNRSPGSILKVRFKQDVGIIRSSQWNFLDNDLNPQQEFNSDYRSRGDQFDENSLDDFQINSKSILFGVDIQGSIDLYHIMKKLNTNLHHRSSSLDILPHLKDYFDFNSQNQVLDMSVLGIPSFRKKILKDSILYERVAMLIIGFVESFEIFQQNRSYVINLINYSFDNMLLRLAILTKGQNKNINEILESQRKENFASKGYDKIKNNNEVIVQTIFKLAKNDNLLYENLKKMIKIGKGVQVKDHFRSILEYFAFFLCAQQKDQKIPFLAVAPSPFLPESQTMKYTLVIDLMQVFCNKNKKSNQLFRPYSEYFLAEMSKYYEIISYSDVMPNEAHKYISSVDKKGYIKYKLFRYHLDKTQSSSGKNLTRLGRKLDKIVVLDIGNDEDKNTICLNSWKGKKNDAQLAEMCPLLAMIAVKKLNTIKAIRKIKQKMNENQKLGLKYMNCGFDLQ